MKIIFDNIVFSLQQTGGISVVWYELLSRVLKDEDINSMYIEYNSCLNNMFRAKLNIPIKQLTKRNPFLFIIDRFVNPTVENNEPFIFHSSYYRICTNHRAINVSTVHDFTYEYFYKGKHKGAFFHIWQRNRAIRKSDAIVCISENTKRDLLKFIKGIDERKIHVIYNGVSNDYQVIDVRDNDFSNSLLFVGGRSSYKNGKFFIDTISKTNYDVVFCGAPLSDSEKEYCNKMLAGRYKCFTHLSNEELNRIYNSCYCLVYPSSYEGFGIPILEAQSAGCPVIAYNNSSIPEVIGDTPLLINELTSEELLLKLELLKDNKLRDIIVSQGLQNAARFSWNRMYGEYKNLYKTLLLNCPKSGSRSLKQKV